MFSEGSCYRFAAECAEIAAHVSELDLGMTLIDTREMDGERATEELVDEAIADRLSA
jgi:diketogulonate reductase-like aldo/keto reductase